MPDARKTNLPDIWSNPHIAAIPLSQEPLLTKELDDLNDCMCLTIDEDPMCGQDWTELLLQYIEELYNYDPYIKERLSSLTQPNNTAYSAASLRRKALKDVLSYLSFNRKLLFYIRRPVSRIRETGFEHLGFIVNKRVGIMCLVQNAKEIPDTSYSKIHYSPMKQILNPNDPVYISYARKESTPLMEFISSRLEADGINVSLDMRDNGPTKSIREYETAIGNGSVVIVVLSDMYFEREDCMFEMAALVKKGGISDRVIFIDALSNVQRNQESHDLIKQRWDVEFKKFQGITATDTAMLSKQKDIGTIVTLFSTFWEYLDDRVAYKASDLQVDNALDLVSLVKERIARLIPQLPQGSIAPLNAGSVPINSVQYGNHNTSIGQINGNVTFNFGDTPGKDRE